MSNGPVLDVQPWNLPEVRQILREKQTVVRDRNRRDFQVHRAGAYLESDQSLKLSCSMLIEVEHRACGEILDQRVQFGVTLDFLV